MPSKIRNTILLIEDDAFFGKVLSQRLDKVGLVVEIVSDGSKALEKALKVKPCLVLLDLILPKKNGFDLLEEIRKTETLKKVHVMVLTNLGQKEDIEHMEKLGIKDYIVKADHSLTEIVNKVIECLK
ncbi:response regulator [Patescibacteria group bacterium]